MKYFYLATLFICLSLFSCKDDLLSVNVKVDYISTHPLRGITINGDSVAYITGGDIWESGFIYTSRDFANSWEEDSIANKLLFDVDTNHGRTIASGVDGRHYELGLSGWEKKNTGFGNYVRAVEVWDEDLALVAGGLAYKDGVIHRISSDGRAENIYEGPSQMEAVAILNPSTYVAAGFGNVIRSDNAGSDWTHIELEGDYYKDLFFLDASNGYLIGQAGSVYKTQDGGVQWELLKKRSIINGSESFNACYFTENGHGWIVGDQGLMIRTTDVGTTWETLKTDTELDLYDVIEWAGQIIAIGEEGLILSHSL